jgi:hypothetical protein
MEWEMGANERGAEDGERKRRGGKKKKKKKKKKERGQWDCSRQVCSYQLDLLLPEQWKVWYRATSSLLRRVTLTKS